MTDASPPEPAAPQPGGKSGRDAEGRVVIKKYANRRLYNTATSVYVTLEHLAEMVKAGTDFVVYDARTGEDITRPVLTQIIFDEESRGQNLLPIQFLRQLIQFYGAQMQSFVPSYLEMSLDALAKHQGRLGEPYAAAPFTPGHSYKLFEEQVRQNMALFDRTMKMFTPMGFTRAEGPPAPEPPTEPPGESLAELRRQVEAMQAQIERLAKKET